MARDGDRHQLGDPITRMVKEGGDAPSLLDQTPAADLTDTELRREIANIDLIVQEAAERGIAPDVLELAQRRLGELGVEFARRRGR